MKPADLMTKARSQLILNFPFFGVLALRLRMVEDATLNPPTLAVDGHKLYYHPDWVAGHVNQTPVIRSGVAHEVIHCALQHIRRRGARDPKRWNIAIDHATNLILKEAGFTVPDTWYCDEQYAGMTAEEIYDRLPESAGEGGGGDGKVVFDNHMAPDKAAESNTADDWRTAMVQAAAVAAGKTPASIKRMVDKILQPQVPWRDVLWRFATSSSKDDISWLRPQRRSLVFGPYLPGRHSESMGLFIAVSDDSGSIGDDVLAAMSAEINGIRASVRPAQTMHISCDAAINHEQTYDADEDFVMASHGGGGTDFRPPFERVNELSLKPDCLVYLTDGYGPFPTTPPDYPVLWCMTTDVVPPWGEYVRIEV